MRPWSKKITEILLIVFTVFPTIENKIYFDGDHLNDYPDQAHHPLIHSGDYLFLPVQANKSSNTFLF